MKRESTFQSSLIKKLYQLFPEAIILKNDPNYIQGIPDLIVLHKDKWAALECKRDKKSSHMRNQNYYVKTMNEMSYARFIGPENEEEVLYDLQRAFES